MFIDMSQFDVELQKHATANFFANLTANLSALALVFFLCTLAMPGGIFVGIFGCLISGFTYAWSYLKIEELETNG